MTLKSYLEEKIQDSKASIKAGWIVCGIAALAWLAICICINTVVERHSLLWEILYAVDISLACSIGFIGSQMVSAAREKKHYEKILRLNDEIIEQQQQMNEKN